MSQLISLDNVSLAFGLDTLLDKVKLQVNKGERICLIGRNGAGKSSLLNIIAGNLVPDSGTIYLKDHLRLSQFQQMLPVNTPGTVFEFIAQGLNELGDLLTEYHHLTQSLVATSAVQDLNRLEKIQQEIDIKNGWQFEQKVKTVLSQLNLNPNAHMATLSGGWQRRAALAKALVNSPELLLLDEPTNHLDIEAIKWLEDFLLNADFSVIFITHDRALLQRIATRIIELDRGQLTSWPGDYQNFMRRKQEMLHAEEKQHAEFDKKLSQEEKWIRQGIKARRTRNEGRVRALKALRDIRSKRREVLGSASFQLVQADKSGELVIEAKHITQHYNNQCIINNFSTRIMRGDRIGLIGPNGIGKTTLLNILLKNNEPQQGIVALGTQLKVAYFDQLRHTLDLEKTVAENVAQGSDTIEINGKKRHVLSYLNDFLFTPARARTPMKALSGGECNRLLLARLFTQPANLIVLDEPTNDLDMETLELLEELLSQYTGTLLLVSHDRVFLDNVVTSTFVFEGEGNISEFVGGYQDWLNQTKFISEPRPAVKIKKPDYKNKSLKLTNKEQQELKELPKKIETLESEQQKLQQLTQQPNFYQESFTKVSDIMNQLAELSTALENAYQRWDELETRANH